MLLISLQSLEYHLITTIILIIAVISFFQFRLSKNVKSKIPGLIIPVLCFIASVYVTSLIDFKKDGNYLLRMLFALFLFNIPTYIMLYVYKDGRKIRKKEEEKWSKVENYLDKIEDKNRNKEKSNT